jgi:hypothetical protein
MITCGYIYSQEKKSQILTTIVFEKHKLTKANYMIKVNKS